MKKENKKILELLNLHYFSFENARRFADETGHTCPTDTKSWSQILCSYVSGIYGLERKKGADLADGSDVKGANTWGAIDTPRFNGVIKAGTKSEYSGKLEYLDNLPYLFFVLWDNEPLRNLPRCRIWSVQCKKDKLFRIICSKWYYKRSIGEIKSNNFQLHPPRFKNSNIFRNTCGNLEYPLLFEAHYETDSYKIISHNEKILKDGFCSLVD